MSLLGVLLAIVAFIIACALVAAADKFLRTKLEYPKWTTQLAYFLLALVLILFLCDQFGVWRLLSSVRV